ncbi:hypothetical protein [Methylovirgula sp. 4M-Z18]|uniref:hypothetical protein n=1 Tax=Methylovirgula sp. 4M-Z18 TaxID=2293567 RepID=UPI000E2F697B|nr:hypothetical protein [Methylovirgula sp. 4M-Z18]RFB78609.1 hypothetical protein DYH55_15490 [Methylovirgula sp. 4M-Z18]
MTWMKTIATEVWGLFVDDGHFAVSIVLWLAVTGGLLPRLGIDSSWLGIILFAGLGLILLESAIRRASK